MKYYILFLILAFYMSLNAQENSESYLSAATEKFTLFKGIEYSFKKSIDLSDKKCFLEEGDFSIREVDNYFYVTHNILKLIFV